MGSLFLGAAGSRNQRLMFQQEWTLCVLAVAVVALKFYMERKLAVLM